MLTEFNAHKEQADDGSVLVSDLDGWGEIASRLDYLWDQVSRNAKGSTPDRRRAAKEVAAMALRFMVERT